MGNTYRVSWIDTAGKRRKSTISATTNDLALQEVRALTDYQGGAQIEIGFDLFGWALDEDGNPIQGAPAPVTEYER